MTEVTDGMVSLAECPIGLFLHGRELCLKTEYGNNEGRIDAYIVSSGEFFWGAPPQTIASQRAQMVRPVPLAAIEAVLAARPEPEGMEPPLLAKALRELSAAMSERNMDMELPDGTIDPTVAAEAIDRLSAEIASLKARLAEAEAEKAKADWQPIETAPFGRPVDVWCLYGDETEAQWESGSTVGHLLPRRSRHTEYGWFGNQSPAGIPQRDAPDLIPVAWRPRVPDCPAEIVEAAIRARGGSDV